MKLSDIFKKISQKQDVQKDTLIEQEQKTLSKETEQPLKEPTSKESLKVSLDEIYGKGIKLLRILFKELSEKKDNIFVNQIKKVAEDIIEAVERNSEEFLLYTCYSTIDNYIYSHSLNVTIYSCVIGKAAKLDRKELKELVLCALLHDIGMVDFFGIITKDFITKEEFEMIKKHSENGGFKINSLNLTEEEKKKISRVVLQIHERADGSGYPYGLKLEDIHMFARIIAIADIFEAKTHSRVYRNLHVKHFDVHELFEMLSDQKHYTYKEKELPYEAMVSIVKLAQSKLDTNLVKVFVEAMGLFPIGSYVKLNTQDIARVVGINPSMPIRPKVKIILTAENQVPKEQQIIDLKENTKITIVEPVDETKLNVQDKKLLLQLKSQHWWVKDGFSS